MVSGYLSLISLDDLGEKKEHTLILSSFLKCEISSAVRLKVKVGALCVRKVALRELTN